jgi:hypothetical protein
MVRKRTHKKIGQLLLEAEAITEEQLNFALERQKGNGQRLGKNLIELDYVDEDEITRYVAEQYNIPHVSLDRCRLNKNLLNIIPKGISKTYGAIPIDLIGHILTLGVVDVPDEDTIRRLEELTGFNIQVMLITTGDFNRYMQRVYVLSVIDNEGGFGVSSAGKYIRTTLYNGKERRRFQRFDRKVRVKYDVRNEYNINSSINVSEGGVLIKSRSPVPVDSHLIVRIELPNLHEDIIIISRVVRAERADGDFYLIALNFSVMDARDRIKLAEFIKSLKENS